MANTINTIKICSINICGMSEKSQILLDHYVNKEKFHIVKVQETNTDDPLRLKLTNMSHITDSNNSQNKGVSLYVNSDSTISKLNEISDITKNIDTTWVLGIVNSKRYIIGTVYLKLNHK